MLTDFFNVFICENLYNLCHLCATKVVFILSEDALQVTNNAIIAIAAKQSVSQNALLTMTTTRAESPTINFVGRCPTKKVKGQRSRVKGER
jgi:hypothetical protein